MTDTREEQFDQWLQTAIRYFVLTNAGGAVAVLSFIGASLGGGSFPKLAIVALVCFAAGLIAAGMVILGQVVGAYQALLSAEVGQEGAEHSIRTAWVTRLSSWVEPRTGRFLVSSFILFVIGVVVGLISLALW